MTVRKKDAHRKANGRFDPRKMRFLEEIVKDGNASAAAIRAGVPKAGAGVTGSYYMRDPYIVQALEKVRANALTKGIYNSEKAMTEANEAIEFAISTDNANAYVKAVELRAKLQGLLVDKIDVRAQVAFSIVMAPLRGNTPAVDQSRLLDSPTAVPVPAPASDLLPPEAGAVLKSPVEETDDNPFEGLDGDTSTLDDPFAD